MHVSYSKFPYTHLSYSMWDSYLSRIVVPGHANFFGCVKIGGIAFSQKRWFILLILCAIFLSKIFCPTLKNWDNDCIVAFFETCLFISLFWALSVLPCAYLSRYLGYQFSGTVSGASQAFLGLIDINTHYLCSSNGDMIS